MSHELPALPYALNALEPRLSAETLEYHWGKHHRGYVEALNRLVGGTSLADLDLESLVRRSSGAVFNDAAQHFNHSLYWLSLSPRGGGEPQGPLGEAIRKRYESFASFRSAFDEMASSHFGSGWIWLVRDPEGAVAVETTRDAGCPLTRGDKPLLACDLWEHAYYIDYRNKRADYLESFWKLVDWRHAEKLFEGQLVAARRSSAPAGSMQRSAR